MAATVRISASESHRIDGENDSGIFFFTTDGNYYEWTGTYLYTDVPVQVDNPIVYVEEKGNE